MTVPPDPTAEPARIPGLDGLRGIAVLAVVVFHAAQFERFAGVPASWAATAWTSVAQFGWAGVDLFFGLSGFLITGILLRHRGSPGYYRNFYARRVLRIFPLYYAVVGLLLYARPGAPSAGEQASFLLYVSNWWIVGNPQFAFAEPALTVTWSLAVEEQFYLVWPLLVAVCSRRALVVVCALLLLAAPLCRWWFLQQGGNALGPYMLTPARIDALAAGALLAAGVRPGPAAARWLGAAAVAAFAAVAAGGTLRGSLSMLEPRTQVLGYSCLALLAVSLITLATGNGVVGWLCRRRWLCAVGKVSYGIYLMHVVLILWLWPLAFDQQDALSLRPLLDRTGGTFPAMQLFTLLVAVLSFALAWLSWHLFEKRVIGLKRLFPMR